MTKTRPLLQTLARLFLVGYFVSWFGVGLLILTDHPGLASILINKSFILLLISIGLLGLNLTHD